MTTVTDEQAPTLLALPVHLTDSLTRYAEHRIPTGGFLRAVLENDLMGAINRADNESRPILQQLCWYVYCELPAECWGSAERVTAWLAGPAVAS